MGKTLLLTAFEPFGGEDRNAALDAVQSVPDRVGDLRIARLTVPTAFGTSVDTVMAAIAREQPDAVLMVGQAGSRGKLTPERRAVNRMHARIPDNAGIQPQEQPIVPGGPEEYYVNLDAEELAQAIRAAGVPAEVSDDAGSFVCNQLLYSVLHWLKTNKLAIPAGFLHVPRTNEQTSGKQPSLPLSQIVDGLLAVIRAIFRTISPGES